METAFTPGPWSVEPYRYCSLAVLNNEGHMICETNWSNISELISQDRQEANARLIAAAPELLQALIDLKATLDPYDYQYVNQLFIINQVIEKATGKKEEEA